jgi:ketosteroid isomerase-like protein
MPTRAFVVRCSAALVVLLFLIAAVGSSLEAGDDKAAKELVALDEAWSKAAGERNVDAVASYYAEDARVYPPNEPIVMGHAAAKEAWAKMLADPSMKLSWKTTASAVEGNMGYTAGTYQMSFNGPDGKPASDTGKTLAVWKKGKDGKWKVIHDMWNSDLKP